MRILNIGSGGKPIFGAVNLDIEDAEPHTIHPTIKPDIVHDGHVLPFENNEFDIVCYFHSLEHMCNPFKTLKEANRVLLYGGMVFIEIPDPFKVNAERDEHLYSWTHNTMRNILRETGFTMIETEFDGIMMWNPIKEEYEKPVLNKLNARYVGVKKDD